MIAKSRTLMMTGGLLMVMMLCGASDVPAAAIEDGDAVRGRALAAEECKHCHVMGAEAGTMHPISKTQQQWQRFVKKDRHETIAPGAWDSIDAQDLKDILQFIHDHAADSDEPATFD